MDDASFLAYNLQPIMIIEKKPAKRTLSQEQFASLVPVYDDAALATDTNLPLASDFSTPSLGLLTKKMPTCSIYSTPLFQPDFLPPMSQIRASNPVMSNTMEYSSPNIRHLPILTETAIKHSIEREQQRYNSQIQRQQIIQKPTITPNELLADLRATLSDKQAKQSSGIATSQQQQQQPLSFADDLSIDNLHKMLNVTEEPAITISADDAGSGSGASGGSLDANKKLTQKSKNPEKYKDFCFGESMSGFNFTRALAHIQPDFNELCEKIESNAQSNPNLVYLTKENALIQTLQYFVPDPAYNDDVAMLQQNPAGLSVTKLRVKLSFVLKIFEASSFDRVGNLMTVDNCGTLAKMIEDAVEY